MKELDRTGVFGLGPGSIDPISRLENTHVLFKEPKGPRSVYTTSIGHEQLFEKHVPPEYLQPMTSLRVLTKNGADFTVPTGKNYYMVDYQNLVSFWRNSLDHSGVNYEIIPDSVANEDIVVWEKDGLVSIDIEGGRYEFDSVIDATGTDAVISRKVEKKRVDENYIAEYVCLGTFKGTAPAGELALFFGPGGGTSWVNQSTEKGPNGEELIDIAFSGWGHKSQFANFKNGEGRQRLEILKDNVKEKDGFSVYDDHPIDITYGMIRSQRIPEPESDVVFPVGESAGAAKPVTGESFNRALYSGELALESIVDGKSPKEYYKDLNKRYKGHDIFLALTQLVMERQIKGETGLLMDEIQRLFNDSKNDQQFVNSMEDFIIKGKMPPRLFLKLLREPMCRDNLIKVASRVLTMKILGLKEEKNPVWAFPDI